MSRPTFVIGDVHGHFDRLLALLEHEGLAEDGRRTNRDVEVVQLGDLGHFGIGTREGDRCCYLAADELLDVVLWGNHDRAVIDQAHHLFRGFAEPEPETSEAMTALARSGKLRMAHAAHGFLLTHAGAHPALGELLPASEERAAVEINRGVIELRNHPLWDAVSPLRGGPMNDHGGILWRDYDEPLSDAWPQVFGHSRQELPMRTGRSWCVDVADIDNGRLAGIWLPEERIASVDLAEVAA